MGGKGCKGMDDKGDAESAEGGKGDMAGSKDGMTWSGAGAAILPAAATPTGKKRGRPPKAKDPPATPRPSKPAKNTKHLKASGAKGSKASVDVNSEVLVKPFNFSESLSRLEITANTATRKRVCLLSFKIQPKHEPTLKTFVTKIRKMLEKGTATKSDIIDARAQWLTTLK